MQSTVRFKRLRVLRVAIAYAATSWLIVEVGERVLPAFDASGWLLRAVMVILMAGFPMAVVLAWFVSLPSRRVGRLQSRSRARAPGRVFTGHDLVIAGIVTVAAMLAILDAPEQPGQPKLRIDRAPSVAVLPLVNANVGRDEVFLADGVSEEILDALAQITQLRVAGRASSFAFRARSDALRLIGDTLDVEHVLTGVVDSSGSNLRITAQLVAIDDGSRIWSQVFEQERSAVFEIRRAIVNAVARELAVPPPDTQRHRPATAEAYRLYLVARQRIHTRTRAMLQTAARMLDRAIELDPGYAPARAQRGIAGLLLLASENDPAAVIEAMKRSREQLDISVMLDARCAEGWAGLGLYHLQSRDYAAAAEALHTALAINPVLSDASAWLEQALRVSGDVAGARIIAEQAVRNDPLHTPAFVGAVDTLNRFGEHDQAFALIEKVRKAIPDDEAVVAAEGNTNLYLGNVAAAYTLLQTAYESAPASAAARSAYGWALTGTRQVERLALEGDRAQRIAALYSLGRTDRAERLAQDMAADGFILPLLQHFNRSGRSADAVAFVDRGWPDLDAFAAAYPHGASGYEEMAELALAYARTGDPRFDAALQRVGEAIDKLAAAGIDNWVFERNRAIYLALGADIGPMFESLEKAIDGGYRDILPLGATRPAFEAVSSDPRFALLELRMRNYIERDRGLLRLML